jgi:hypothetical protein
MIDNARNSAVIYSIIQKRIGLPAERFNPPALIRNAHDALTDNTQSLSTSFSSFLPNFKAILLSCHSPLSVLTVMHSGDISPSTVSIIIMGAFFN